MPGQFALILDRDYEKAPSNSFFTIKDSTVILTVNASSIAGGLTQTKGLLLYSGTGTFVKDSLAAFHDPGSKIIFGTKIETTQPIHCKEGFSQIPDNLFLSPFSIIENPDTLSLGTYEFLYDTWICEYNLTDSGTFSQNIACQLTIMNIGKKYPQNTHWSITKGSGTKPIFEDFLPYLRYPIQLKIDVPKDTTNFSFTLIAETTTTSIPIYMSNVLLPPSPIKINEIYPRGNSSIPEWIELLNSSPMQINLKNWRFGVPDNIDTISSSDLILNPGDLILLTKDITRFDLLYPTGVHRIQPLTWPVLNNYRDTIVIFNHLDSVPCETVCYDNDWFELWNTHSIARVFIDKLGTERSTWVLSPKPSPGLPNPEISWQSVVSPTLDISPIPFTPNGDGEDDLLNIKITLPSTSQASIDIYGFNGKKMYQFKYQVQHEMTWDGKTSHGAHAPVGPFFVVETIKSGSKEIIIRKKGILWR